jgi:ABC-type uncharacterized transport system involved in gliding motility auxiliary subunit
MSRWPALLGALGAVVFGFGLLSVLLAFFQPLMPAAMVYGNLFVGFLLLVAWASFGFDSIRARLRSGGGRRRGVRASVSLLKLGLLLAILVMLAFLSTRYSRRFDWSEQRVNTLSDASRELVSKLDRSVVLTAFFREQDSPAIRDLLDRYDDASERVAVRFVDPNVRPDLVEAHELSGDDLARGLILAESGDASVQIVRFGESDISNALIRLTRSAERTVYFVEGHNERRIRTGAGAESDPAQSEQATEPAGASGPETAEGRAGFSRAAASLRNETYRVEPLLLATAEELPADADALVIAGPTRPFFESEIALLERYLSGGGSLLVMIDPRAQTNLNAVLERWGVAMGDDVVFDPLQSLNRQPTSPVAESHAQDHPIGASLSRSVFPMARSVAVVPGAAGSELREIVFSGDTSWAERDLEAWINSGLPVLDDADLAGPVPLVVAGRPFMAVGAAPDARLVAIGDSSFATNEYFDAFENRDLLLNTISWLLGDVEHISVRPNVARSSNVALTARQFQAIQYFSLLVLPEGIALLGVLTWWSRRRSTGP